MIKSGCKMIVTDLDRTLLATDKKLSLFSQAILKKCKDKNIKTVFATARPKRSIQKYLQQIDIDAVIIHNGAIVLCGDKILNYSGIASKTAKKIILSILNAKPNLNLSIEINDTLYCNFDLQEGTGVPIKTDFYNLPDYPVDKIAIRVNSMDDIDFLSGLLPKNVYIEMSDPNGEVKLGLIMSKKATKSSGIKTLAKHFKIKLEDIVAFGDDYNDIGMLKVCGTGVAMENALDEVKAVADFVCDTNDNDGVAKWIERNILCKRA